MGLKAPRCPRASRAPFGEPYTAFAQYCGPAHLRMRHSVAPPDCTHCLIRAQPEMLDFEVWLGQGSGWGSSPP